MTGVDSPLDATREHHVIAGTLTLDPQPARYPPHARMKPVHGAGDTGDQLGKRVPPLDVRQLMTNDDAPSLVIPFTRFGRQHDHGSPDSPRERSRNFGADQDIHP